MDDLAPLVVAPAGGARAAFASLVRRTQPDVWRLCSHLVDADAVDDVAQDTFLRVAKALPSFRGDGPARSWILSIARRAAADEVRRRRRRRALQARLDAEPTEVATPAATGEVDLHALLEGLDEDRRTAFVLTQVLGLSYQAAADVCDWPIGTIRSRVARARLDLLDRLGGSSAIGE